MTVQRDPDDPERIGADHHPDDCDCERCFPTVCGDCGDDTEGGYSLCRNCRAISDAYAGEP